MHLVLIRHGLPDYTFVTERKFIGNGRDLAQLSEKGIRQAEAVSHDERLSGADFIVSSPYTRALQTAAIISKNTGLEIKIENDLHEWMPDKSFLFDSEDYVVKAVDECSFYMGVRPETAKYNWEDLSEVAERAYKALYKYESCKKIIVVCHGVVMRQFVYADYIPYCGIIETEFDHSFKWNGYNISARNRYNNKVFLATEQDIEGWMGLVNIVKDSFPGLDKEEYIGILRKCIESKTALCYISDGKITGILLFSPEQSCLSFLAVHPDHRKKGVATSLINKMLELMPDSDINVTTFREDDKMGVPARALYKKYGFEEAELFTEFGYPAQRFVLHRQKI